MKFLFALSTLLAAAFTTTVQADEVCSVEKDIHFGEGDSARVIGFWKIEDVNNNLMTFTVKITETLAPDGLSIPFIEKVVAQLCCAGVDPDCPSAPEQVHGADTHTIDDEITFTIIEPDCDPGVATDVKLRFYIQSGGVEGYTDIFPPPSHDNSGGVPVKFMVQTDAGDTDDENSYFDITFKDVPEVPEALRGMSFNGYCVDAGNSIGTNRYYNAIAYSFFGTDWANAAPQSIGNIDKPQNMPNVAYCINEYTIGASYPQGTLSSGTMQRAIWGIIDDLGVAGPAYCTGTRCGLGSNDIVWAQAIADDCLDNGDNFVPGCNDKVPVIVVVTDNDGNVQNQYVQTTFADLGLSCEEDEDIVNEQLNCITGGSGSSGGDPHFKTFGEEWFDFHGGCDLLLASFPDFADELGLTIDVRTTTRYDYSFIETAAIKIGEDILEISSHGQYMLNSISNAEFPMLLAGFPVEYTQPRAQQHLFTIDLGNEKSIVVKVYKDLVYVDINVHDGNNAGVKNGIGMLGTWLGGTRLARDGVTVMDNDTEYGQEWQVRDTDAQLFTTARAPQWPAKCEMPNPAERASRRLGEHTVSSEEAAAACADIKEPHQHDMCVFDVIATADISVAQGGAY